MLELIIHEKKVETITREEYVRGTVGAKCKITFDEFWQNYEKTVVFKRCDYSIPPIRVLVDKMEITSEIPPEVLAEIGSFMVGVYGITEDEKLPTLYSEEFNVVYGTDTECADPAQYTPNEVEQLRLMIVEQGKKTNEAIGDIDAALDELHDYAQTLVTQEKFDDTVGDIEAALSQI